MAARRKKAMPAITNVKEAIQALGGPVAVGQALNIGQSAVSMWIIRGQVSPSGSLPVYRSLIDRGYSRISPAVFGYKSWGDTIIPRLRIRKPRLKKAA
jgi:hypothetical protein